MNLLLYHSRASTGTTKLLTDKLFNHEPCKVELICVLLASLLLLLASSANSGPTRLTNCLILHNMLSFDFDKYEKEWKLLHRLGVVAFYQQAAVI